MNSDLKWSTESLFHKAGDRGFAEFSWLKSYHSFNFGTFWDRNKQGFGQLKVLNDDQVQAGKGFGEHPHANMEIISIPLKGHLIHKDSEGHQGSIHVNSVQVMSAGTGIFHSEWNGSNEEDVCFLQIWVAPWAKRLAPRYDQVDDLTLESSVWQYVLGPLGGHAPLEIYQNAHFWLMQVETRSEHPVTWPEGLLSGQTLEVLGPEAESPEDFSGFGFYLFVIDGEIELDATEEHARRLSSRDAMGWRMPSHVQATDALKAFMPALTCRSTGARLLLMQVPMGQYNIYGQKQRKTSMKS